MKKRILYILVPSLLFIGVMASLIISQFSSRLPAEAQDILNSYLEAIPGEVTNTTVMYALDIDQFTAEMGRPLLHAPIEEYRTSPVLFDGDVIRPPEEATQFPLPVQELWCVTLTQQNKAAEYYFLARHDNLYGATWVLYQSPSGKTAAQTVGCNPA